MSLNLTVMGVLAVLTLGSLTARQMERGWRESVERDLAVCNGRLEGLGARDRARDSVDRLSDPAGELFRRYGR